MSIAFTVSGLVFDIFGVWLVAYEIIFGYPKRNRAMFHERTLAHHEQFLSEMLSGTDALAEPPYASEEKHRLRLELHKTWDPKISDVKNKLDELGEGHRTKSFHFALLGVGFITVGFVLQIIVAASSSLAG
jgi:hypothetical protein